MVSARRTILGNRMEKIRRRRSLTYRLQKRFTAAAVVGDLLRGCLVDLFPPAFPVATPEGAAIEVGEQKAQPIGAGNFLAAHEACIQTGEILRSACFG